MCACVREFHSGKEETAEDERRIRNGCGVSAGARCMCSVYGKRAGDGNKGRGSPRHAGIDITSKTKHSGCKCARCRQERSVCQFHAANR